MKNVIPAVIVGVMVLVLATSGLAEAKPGVVSVHISVKNPDGANAGGVPCVVFGSDVNNQKLTNGFGVVTNNGGKGHVDVSGTFDYVIVGCNGTSEELYQVSAKGPTKVTIQL